MSMAEVTPMRGRRVKAIRCPVEGHADCEVVRFASPYDRESEVRLFRADVGDELGRETEGIEEGVGPN